MDWIYVSKKIGSLFLFMLIIFSWVFQLVADYKLKADDSRGQIIVSSLVLIAISVGTFRKVVKYLVD